jgi:hypothetical protein
VQLTNHTVGGDYDKNDVDNAEEEGTKPALGEYCSLPRIVHPLLVAARVVFLRRLLS